MELPGKMGYDARLSVLLHRTLYPTFGQTAGWAEGVALLSVLALTWRVRKRAFALTATAASCQVAAMAVFLAVVNPANVTRRAGRSTRSPRLNRDKRLVGIVGIVSLGDLAVRTGDRGQVGEVLHEVSEPAGAAR
jgi:hypothetical protein